MAFSVSYQSLSTYNIKHMYSGQLEDLKWRTVPHGRAIVLPTIVKEIPGPSKEYKLYLNNRYLEYNRKYKGNVPRAPAFRRFSRKKVDRVVRRLSAISAKKCP